MNFDLRVYQYYFILNIILICKTKFILLEYHNSSYCCNSTLNEAIVKLKLKKTYDEFL